jgi:uncharacterized membrane protein
MFRQIMRAYDYHSHGSHLAYGVTIFFVLFSVRPSIFQKAGIWNLFLVLGLFTFSMAMGLVLTFSLNRRDHRRRS